MMTYIIELIVGPRYDRAGRDGGRETASAAPRLCGRGRSFRIVIISQDRPRNIG